MWSVKSVFSEDTFSFLVSNMVLHLNLNFLRVSRTLVINRLGAGKKFLNFRDQNLTILECCELRLDLTFAFGWLFGTGTLVVVRECPTNDIDWSTPFIEILLDRSTIWPLQMNRTASRLSCLHPLLLPELPLPCLAPRSLNKKLAYLGVFNLYLRWGCLVIV